MASANYDAGLFGIANRSIDFVGGTIKVMLIGTATPYTFDRSQTVMTLPAASELDVAGYAKGFAGAGRKALTSKSIAFDGTAFQTNFKSVGALLWTLETGGTVAAAVIYLSQTSDAASTPISYLDFADKPTNGADMSLSFPSDIVFYLKH